MAGLWLLEEKFKMQMTPIQPKRREWLKALRLQKKLTIRGLAPLLDMSWQHYSDIEAGRRNPSIETSIKIADFFDIETEHFFVNRTKFEQKKID
jgi:DNA-binding XRE family transcriptional regulator